MQNRSLNYSLLGLFVIGMLAAAIGTTVALSGRGGAHDRYVVQFDNVADIAFGSQVRFEGFPVGQVEEIRPVVRDGATVFDLDIGVREGWRIPDDSVAVIGSSTFLGAKTVEIRRGASKTALDPGARIASAPPADMLAAMSRIAGEFGDLSRDGLRPMLSRMAGLVAHADDLLANDLAQLVRSLNRLTAGPHGEVPQIVSELLSFTRELNATLASMQGMLSESNVARVGNSVENVERVSRRFVEIGDSLEGTLRQVNAIVANVDHMVQSNEGRVSGALRDTQYVLHSLARNIDNFNHNISGTARNMNEFSRLIRQNPNLLLGGSPREEVGSGDTVPASVNRSDVP